MKKRHLVYAIALIVGMGAGAASSKIKLRKQKVQTFITGSFRMRSLISKSRHALYWLLFITHRKTA